MKSDPAVHHVTPLPTVNEMKKTTAGHQVTDASHRQMGEKSHCEKKRTILRLK